jgi:glycine/D-amino acid oxidase-like deaminating enzyme
MVLRKVVTTCSQPNTSLHEAQDTVIDNPNHERNPRKQPQDFLPVPNPMTSYWLKQPHPYAKLRTTPHLPVSCDIAIIGSGMAGILTAYHILQTSHANFLKAGTPMPRIVLLDARDLCSGATARNGGHSKVKTATLTSLADGAARTAFQDYVHRTHMELKALVDAEALAVKCEFELRRSFDVFQDKEEFEGVKMAYDEDARVGQGWTKRTSVVPGEWVERITGVRGSVGAFSVESASFWPYKLVCGVLEGMVEKFGEVLNVQMNTVVTRLASSPSTASVERTSRDASTTTITTRVVNVLETPRGTLTAKKVVLATNAYTASLLPSFSKTIVPYKGMNSHHAPSPSASSSSPHPNHTSHATQSHLNNTYNIHFAPLSPKHPTGCDYLNPRPDGSIVVGGGSWFYQNKHNEKYDSGDDDGYAWLNTVDDSTETGHFPADVYAHWTHYMSNTFLSHPPPSSSSRFEPDSIWTGIQGKTNNGMPHIGRVPPPPPPPDKGDEQQQQWMLAGFNGGGMALIPLAAKAVAKMVLRDLDFEHVQDEFGLLEGMGTGDARMVS